MGNVAATPTSIERAGSSALKIVWADQHESLYPWPYLRGNCPCAACRERNLLSPDPKTQPMELAPVGNYAMAIRWMDGHTTGIFSHEYLRSICPCSICKPTEE